VRTEYLVITLQQLQDHMDELGDYAWRWNTQSQPLQMPLSESLSRAVLRCGPKPTVVPDRGKP
jgi:hypothetical protein